MEQPSEYVDTEIIECNNLSSVQRLGGNKNSNSVFTNRLGKNLNLKRGDKITLQQCFINERGCGVPNAVELEGNNLNVKQTYHYTDIQSKGAVGYNVMKKMDTAEYQTATLTPKIKELKDNELNIEMNFYTNTNGEGYYFLPRRYATNGVARQKLASGQATNQFLRNIVNNTHEYWTGNDDTASGRVFYERGSEHLDDLYSVCLNDMLLFTDTSPNGKFGYFKPLSDGGRLTIMVRDQWIQNYDYNDATKKYWDELPAVRDPAMGKYHIYQDLLEIEIPTGYNSPQNIAELVTEKLQEARPPEQYYLDDKGNPVSNQEWVTLYSTKSYKPFNCASFNCNLATNFAQYQDNTSKTIDAMNYDASYQHIGVKRPDLFVLGRLIDLDSDGSPIANYIKNDIDSTIADGRKSEIVTSYEYTEPNLQKLSTLFVAQGQYPELFNNNNIFFGSQSAPEVSLDNSRFLHINRYNDATGNIDNKLGYDNYVDKGANRNSMPLFFFYDKTYEGKSTEGTSTDRLSYGFATKTLLADGKYYITLHPELFTDGIRSYVFQFQNQNKIVKDTTQIGWDWHFNAYSTIAVQLWSGYTNFTYDDSYNFGIADRVNSAGDNIFRYNNPNNTGEIISKVYLGANNSSLIYDANGHFAFTSLHTAENVGQSWNAGSNKTTNPILENAGDECYKINKKLELWSWTPEMRPYSFDSNAYGVVTGALTLDSEIWFDDHDTAEGRPKWTMTEIGGQGNTDGKVGWGAIKYEPNNPALSVYDIIDCDCGIILNLGDSYTEDTYGDGLLGIMGFSYEQFNPTIIDSTNNITSRITTENENKLKYITTNSQLVETETKNFVVNTFGAVQYTNQVPSPMMYEGWINKIKGNTKSGNPLTNDGGGHADRVSAYSLFPVIVEQTTSITIKATRLPRRMIRPYYCIRSDLLLSASNSFIGGRDGNAVLPIIGLVNKENGFGDYFFSGETGTQFTITKDNSVCEITTTITNPDQSLANVDDGCCIVYKIERNKILDNSIIQELIQASQPKSK